MLEHCRAMTLVFVVHVGHVVMAGVLLSLFRHLRHFITAVVVAMIQMLMCVIHTYLIHPLLSYKLFRMAHKFLFATTSTKVINQTGILCRVKSLGGA